MTKGKITRGAQIGEQFGRTATLIVAALNSPELSKAQADYVCDGTADDVEIQAAIDALPAGGGSIALLEGTFNLTAQLARAIDNVAIGGQGASTILNLDDATPVISAGVQANWLITNLATDAGGIDIESTSAPAGFVNCFINGELFTKIKALYDADDGTAQMNILQGRGALISLEPPLQDAVHDAYPKMQWRAFNPTSGLVEPVAFVVAHYKHSDGTVHQHWSIETVNADGSFGSKFGIGRYGETPQFIFLVGPANATPNNYLDIFDFNQVEPIDMNLENMNLTNLLSNGNFEVGDPPTSWFTTTCSIVTETTIVKIGSRSLKVHTPTATYACGRAIIPDYNRYKGRAVTFGAWVYAPSTNVEDQYLALNDGIGNSWSGIIPRDDDWHWMTVTRTIDTGAITQVSPRFHVSRVAFNAGDVLYGSGAILVEGTSCPAFSPKPNDSIINHHTAAYTISRYESGHVVHTNLGAGGAIQIELPQTVTAGFTCHFAVMAAQELRIHPGAAGAIYINGAKQTDDKYIWADDEGESVTLVADGNGDWVAMYSVGTWGVEL